MWGGVKAADGGDKTRVPVSLSDFMAGPDGDQAFHPRGGQADPAEQLEEVARLAGERPAAVFWIGGQKLTEAVLWRHLRGLNNVLIPKGYGGEDAPAGRCGPGRRRP